MPRALFPALAVVQYGGGAELAGILYAAPAVGSLLAGALSGPIGRVHRQGLGVMASVAVWGLAIVGFGLAPWPWLGVLLLAVAGAADLVSSVLRNTIFQVAAPDAMRGRLYGLFIVVVTGGPRLGDLESGSVAALTSPSVSAWTGGLLCLFGLALLAAAYPAIARYRVDAEKGPTPPVEQPSSSTA
jgi:MFS family permease